MVLNNIVHNHYKHFAGKEEKTMKNLVLFTALIVLFLTSSCVTHVHTAAAGYDDIYYTPGDKVVVVEQKKPVIFAQAVQGPRQ